MDLNRFLKPRNYAIVGATDKEGFGGGSVHTALEYDRDLDHVFFVNPKRDSLFGRPCYQSLEEIGEAIDTVVICTPKKTVAGILRQAKEVGAAGAVVFAAGYSEIGTEEGKQDEAELVRLSKELDLAIMGPNCCGFVNYVDQKFCYAIEHPHRDRQGKVGFVSQSGQVCMSLMDSPNMTFSYCISCGNSKAVPLEEYLDFLIEDADTKVVAFYLEGVNDPARFEKCLRKAAIKRKPMVALKVGKSARAGKIASSHTGSMAGSDAVYDALFWKYGVLRVDDMQELLSTSLAFATMRTLPKGSRFSVVCLSGGETAICADEGFKAGITYADFSEETVEKLRGLLPFYASPQNNPLDITATPAYDPDTLAETLLAVLRDDNVDMVLLGFTLMDEIVDHSFYIMFEGIEKALAQTDKPFACLNFIEMSRNRDLESKFENLGVPVLPCTQYAFQVLRHLRDFAQYSHAHRELCLALPTRASGKTRMLGEWDSRMLLKAAGIPVDLGVLAKSEEDAIVAAKEIGVPVVLKVESAEIPHKSDVGGVALNLKTEQEVRDAYRSIRESVARLAPQAVVNGVLVQKMLPKGIEVILGVKRDPQFGPMLLLGLGGIFAELYHDVALYPVPLNRAEAMEMIRTLRAFPLLSGYRGAPPLDLDALSVLMAAVSRFASENRDHLTEMDLNPVKVYEHGVSIADALIVLTEK